MSLLTSVYDIKPYENKYKVYVKTNKKTKVYDGTKVIIACSANALKSFSILKPIFPLLKHIYTVPVLRVVAMYPKHNNKVWFEGMPKIITNHIVRQIIPFDVKKGLIYITYCDTMNIYPFLENKKEWKLKSKREIKSICQKCLKDLFPNLHIPPPTYFNSYIWYPAVHGWKPKCDSQNISSQIKHPRKNMYIVGEAYSDRQGWIEGALETVKDAMEHL